MFTIRKILVSIIVFLLSSSALAAHGKKHRVIIVYNNGVTANDVSHARNRHALVFHQHKLINAITAEISDDDEDSIKSNKNIQAIFDDEIVYSSLLDSVPQIRANLVQSSGVTGAGVPVCVVDSGVDKNHSSLPLPIAEINFVDGTNDATDDYGHGTHVSGIVLSRSVYKGVAPAASLLAAKVLDDTGAGYMSDVIAGIEWCVTNHAKIINMSLGGGAFTTTCDTDLLAQAANNAVTAGVTVFAASGNSGYSNAVMTPACGSKVIAVGAVDKSDLVAYYSNGSSKIAIVAPGSDITSTIPGGLYGAKTGTSMATPHAAGTAALLLQANPTLSPADILSILKSTSKDLGAPGYDTWYGYGRIDAYAAYQAALTFVRANIPPVANPGPSQSLTDSDSSGFEPVILNGSASSDQDGTIAAYQWRENSTVLGNAAKITVNLPVGTHNLSLTITDNAGAKSSASISVVISPAAVAGADIFFDNFQSGFNKWNVLNYQFKWIPSAPAASNVPGYLASNIVAHSDSCSANGGCILKLGKAIDLSKYKSATLKFWRYVGANLARGEYLKVDIYTDFGWETVMNFSNGQGNDGTWHLESYNLSQYLNSGFLVRFVSKESSSSKNVEVDDVRITGVLR